MHFYTNVTEHRSKLLVTGYLDGKRYQEIINYRPYLFVRNPSDQESRYRTIHGVPVTKKKFNSIWDARQYIREYGEVDGFEIFGLDKFNYVYINDTFPNIQYDLSLIKLAILDIEVATDTGFPDIDLADKEVTAITVMYNDITFVFGLKEYQVKEDKVKYIHCKSEEELLKKFLKLWSSDAFRPDVVTGWNCLPLSTNIWKENEIVRLDQIVSGESLFDSNVKNVSPVSKKERWDITLANGYKMSSSEEHRWPLIICEPDQYTKFSNRKVPIRKEDVETRNIDTKNLTYFVEMPIRQNTNNDILEYTDDQLYLAGLIFTDGSVKDDYAFNVYQSDEDFMNLISSMAGRPYYLTKEAQHNSKDQFVCPVLKKQLGFAVDLIYQDNKKCLNITKLSRLSNRQFKQFLSGIMDGDGCFSRGKMSISNSTENLEIIEQLLLWNGIFTYKSGKNISFDLHLNELFLKKKSRWNKDQTPVLYRNNSQKAKYTKYKKIGDIWYVRIKKVEKTNIMIDMMDIETDTNYFIANGIRTHNCEFFDIPYIVRRIAHRLGEDHSRKLSPFGVLKDRVVEVFGKPHTVFMPLGLNILDYLQLYKKFTYVMRDSYKLDNIAEVELGEKKIDYSMYGSLNELYIQNHDLFIEYNIHDCTLIKKLEHKLQLLALVYEFSYDSGTNFEDSLRPVRTWDIIIHNHLMKMKRVIPQYKKSDISFGNPVGAHVKDAIPNGYEWVVSFDLTSLYPHLIIGYNISPDTFKGKIKKPFSVDQLLDMEHLEQYLQYIKDNNLSFAANGCLYDNSKQGFLGELMQDLFDKRKLYKKKMLEEKQQFEKTHDPKHTFMIAKYNNLQQNAKIKLNSCYGAMLNEGFRYYSKDFAESITISGQLTIRWAEKKLNEFLNQHNGTIGKDYIIASDTDSCYINMKDLVDKQNLTTIKEKVDWVNSFCEEKIQPYLDAVYQELANNMNCFKQAMHMKRESICEKGLFFAKKRYVLRSWDDEGVRYEKPKTKMTGIEAVRSTTPSSVRAAIKECIDIILDGDEQKTRQYIKDFREKFETLPFYEIAFTRGINGLEKYSDHNTIYKKATPIHVRAALLYNNTLKRFSLIGKYNLIVEKDKVKFCYMRMPNPIHENVFGAPGDLPKELDLEKYIDYDKQFDKAFIDPIKSILQVLNWQHEDQDTLSALFGGEIS